MKSAKIFKTHTSKTKKKKLARASLRNCWMTSTIQVFFHFFHRIWCNFFDPSFSITEKSQTRITLVLVILLVNILNTLNSYELWTHIHIHSGCPIKSISICQMSKINMSKTKKRSVIKIGQPIPRPKNLKNFTNLAKVWTKFSKSYY